MAPYASATHHDGGPSLPPRDTRFSCFPRWARAIRESSRDLPHSPDRMRFPLNRKLHSRRWPRDYADDGSGCIDPTVAPRVLQGIEHTRVHRPAGVPYNSPAQLFFAIRSSSAQQPRSSSSGLLRSGSPAIQNLPRIPPQAFPAHKPNGPRTRSRRCGNDLPQSSTRVRAAGVPALVPHASRPDDGQAMWHPGLGEPGGQRTTSIYMHHVRTGSLVSLRSSAHPRPRVQVAMRLPWTRISRPHPPPNVRAISILFAAREKKKEKKKSAAAAATLMGN